MIDSAIKTLVYKINSFINDHSELFIDSFCIKIFLNIENKEIFNKGFCGAITAKGLQCSRKPNNNSIFCGLHRCDKHAHIRKKNKTINYFNINDNITKRMYEVVCIKESFKLNMNYLQKLRYHNDEYLLDIRTNTLYKKFKNEIRELGNFYRFNYNFQYV